MKCVFVTVFNQARYVDMLFMLLESLFIYGCLDETTHILVYTSTPFMELIKTSHLFSEKIKFEINDTYNDIDKACKARLDLFRFPSVDTYSKILYLDTDVLVKSDLNPVFEVCKENVLYARQEGRIGAPSDFWGRTLFGGELRNHPDKSAFTSGILLFNNCERIKYLFHQINEDMVNRPRDFRTHDQPYIVYNAFKHRLYDNKTLNEFVVNNNTNIHSNIAIHHFPGGPGNHAHKMVTMTDFLNRLKEFTISNNIERAKAYIDLNLLPIITRSGERHEGNIFMLHHTTTYTKTFANKAKNISNLVLNKNIKSVMEIGFNSGFSTLLMLLTNPGMHIDCFDLGEHKYTLPCYEKLKETFGDRISITIGDSTKTLPQVDAKFDLIHIDGGHSTDVARSDITNSHRLSKPRTILVMDDYDFPNLHKLWDNSITAYNLKKLDISVYESPHHDIKYVSP